MLDISRPAVSGPLDALAAVARERTEAAIECSLSAARELLCMDLAYVAEADRGGFRFRALDGDGAPFGIASAGARVARRDTLCDRML